MIHIHNYNKFLINESNYIALEKGSIYYDKICRCHNFILDDIIDIFEISEIPVKISSSYYLSNKEGNRRYDLSDKYINSNDLYLTQLLKLTYQFPNVITINSGHADYPPSSYKIMKIDDYNKLLSSLSSVNDDILKLCKRIEDNKGIEINITSCIENYTDENYVVYNLKIIDSEPIPKDKIKQIFKEWEQSTLILDLNKNIDRLKGLYKKEGIDNAPIEVNPDSETDDLENVLIGFWTEDEIIVVATYNKVTRQFDINDLEFSRSIDEYWKDNDPRL